MEDNGSMNEDSSMEKKSNNKMTMMMVLVVIIVVAVVGVYFFLSNKNSTAPAMTGEQNMQTETNTTTSGESMESTSGGTMDENSMQEASVKEFTVDGSEFAYSPSTLDVSAGDTVKLTFKNTGNYPHNLDIPDLGVQTKTINPGETDTVQFTADKAGTYTFYCTVDSHKDKGMVGTLNVQ